MYPTTLKRYTLPTGRHVVEPNPQLKTYLKQLNNKAVDIYENLLATHGLQDVPQAYRRNHSVKTNAALHRNQKQIHKFDFSGFYDSITFRCIKPYLRQLNAPPVKGYYIDPKTNGLIQGSPLSGTLAGMVLIPFWKELRKQQPQAIITQYSDDLAISNTTLSQQECRKLVVDTLRKCKLPCRINNKKTTTHTVHRRITGVTINHKNQITTTRKFYRDLRAICHGITYNHKHISDYGYRDMQHFRQVLSYHRYIDDTGKINRLLSKYHFS